MVFEGKFDEIGQGITAVHKQYLGCFSASNLVAGCLNKTASRAAKLRTVVDGLKTACIISVEKCLLKRELGGTSKNLGNNNMIDYRHNGSEDTSG